MLKLEYGLALTGGMYDLTTVYDRTAKQATVASKYALLLHKALHRFCTDNVGITRHYHWTIHELPHEI